MPSGLISSEGCEEGSVSCLFPSFKVCWPSSAFLGLQHHSISAFRFMSHSFYVCFCLQWPPFYKETDWLYCIRVYANDLIFFFCFFFRVTLVAYGSSQTRGQIGAAAAGTWQLQQCRVQSHVCNLSSSSQQCQILNPLNKVRGQTRIIMDTSQVCNSLSHSRNPQWPHFNLIASVKIPSSHKVLFEVPGFRNSKYKMWKDTFWPMPVTLRIDSWPRVLKPAWQNNRIGRDYQ